MKKFISKLSIVAFVIIGLLFIWDNVEVYRAQEWEEMYISIYNDDGEHTLHRIDFMIYSKQFNFVIVKGYHVKGEYTETVFSEYDKLWRLVIYPITMHDFN